MRKIALIQVHKVELKMIDYYLITVPTPLVVDEIKQKTLCPFALSIMHGLAPDGVDIVATRNKDYSTEEP